MGSFRNPAGVAFKLQNIRQVATGQGLEHASKTDRDVWRDLGGSPEVVRKVAALIRAQDVSPAEVDAIGPEEEFVEGRVMTAAHKRRERSGKARSELLRARSGRGPLRCDACQDGPKIDTPDTREAGFEAHHTLPLASSGVRATRLRDLALLCATCHRLIHRLMHVRRVWVSVEQLEVELAAHAET